MFFFLQLSLSLACPSVQCAVQDLGVCATVNNSQILINMYGCTDVTFCSAESLFTWYANGGIFLYCDQFNSGNTDTSDVVCGVRDLNESLMVDVHPKRCNSSNDCLMKNGRTSECLCGLDGFMYCMPQWGSEVFDVYWMFCDGNNGNATYEYYQYFQAMYAYYNYYITAPDCAMNIFNELQALGVNPAFGQMSVLCAIYFLI